MSLCSLPSDILFDIFTLFDDLQDLLAVASTSRSLNRAFKDHRIRALQRVFRQQIIGYRDGGLPPPKTGLLTAAFVPTGGSRCHTARIPPNPLPRVVLECIQPIMSRYETSTSSDRLILRSTAWTTFVNFKSPEWIFTSLGEELISLCRTVGREDLVLSYSAELWQYISTRQTYEHQALLNKSALDRRASSFARALATQYYHKFKSPEDAARTILKCYNMEMRDYDYELFPYLLKYTQDVVDSSKILSFFRQRAATEREALVADGKCKGNIHWTFCLVLLLSDLGQIQDAICVFNNTYVLYPAHTFDLSLFEALARRLIKSFKNQKYHDEAFVIYQQILTLLARTQRTIDSRYTAWGKQYTSDLYSAGRPEDALAVEEKCWDQIRDRLTIRMEFRSLYAGKCAAWALSRSYERRGQDEKAMRVRREYETLSARCMKPGGRVIWPGEDGSDHPENTGDEDWRKGRLVACESAHGRVTADNDVKSQIDQYGRQDLGTEIETE